MQSRTFRSMEVGGEGTPQAPIHKLHYDLLSLIFELNSTAQATPDSDSPFWSPIPPITTTRHTSQVCILWRNILLTSPSLWGRLIDLDMLDQSTDSWRNEIMHRAGSAYLWVTGCVSQLPCPAQTFFFSVISDSDSWTRIQRIIVDVRDGDLEDPRWNALCYPAPSLEVFHMNFLGISNSTPMFFHSRDVSESPLPQRQTLFGNDAPSLRHFDAIHVFFGLDASWLPHLHDMSFQSWFPVAHVLKLLQKMPHLQSLRTPESFERLEGFTADSYAPILPYIHLPNVTNFDVLGRFEDCNQYMEHINPGPRCSFSFTPVLSENSALDLQKLPLSKHMQNYVKTRHPIRLRFDFSREMFFFQLSDDSDSPYRNCNFTVNIFSWDGIPFDLACLLLESVPSFRPYFNLIHYLSLYFYRSTDPAFFVNLRSVLEAMSSISRLCTSSHSIQVLSTLGSSQFKENAHFPLFPELRTVQITSTAEDFVYPKTGDLDGILPFLRMRRDAGLPISELDLAKCHPDLLHNVAVLEELKGLRVRWMKGEEQVEYICGESL